MQTLWKYMVQKYMYNKKYHWYIPALILQKTNEFYNTTHISGYIKNQYLYLKVWSNLDKYRLFSKQQELLLFLNAYALENWFNLVLLRCIVT